MGTPGLRDPDIPLTTPAKDIKKLKQYMNNTQSLAVLTRLYQRHDWADYDESIMSQVCLPEGLLFRYLNKIMSQVQEPFFNFATQYWPGLCEHVFGGQYECVSFGASDEAKWHPSTATNPNPLATDYGPPPGSINNPNWVFHTGVTWDEFTWGLQQIGMVRNVHAHPGAMHLRGRQGASAEHYDLLLFRAQYFFVVLGQTRLAQEVYDMRTELGEQTRAAFAKLLDIDIVPRRTGVITGIGYSNGQLLSRFSEDYVPKRTENVQALWNGVSLDRLQKTSIDLMVTWFNVKKDAGEFFGAPDGVLAKEQSMQLTSRLKDLLYGREGMITAAEANANPQPAALGQLAQSRTSLGWPGVSGTRASQKRKVEEEESILSTRAVKKSRVVDRVPNTGSRIILSRRAKGY